MFVQLQQCLPFTVLKLPASLLASRASAKVATVLTVYGIETCNAGFKSLSSTRSSCNSAYRLRYWNRMVLCVYTLVVSCNSAYRLRYWNEQKSRQCWRRILSCNSAYRLRYWNPRFFILYPQTFTSLQQCLPFTVLKLKYVERRNQALQPGLQQCLPFTVLKRNYWMLLWKPRRYHVATVLTVYGIETFQR